MPWSSSSSPRRRSEVMRPPRSGRISISQGPPRILTTPRIVVSKRPKALAILAIGACLLTACRQTPVAHLPSPSPAHQPTPAPQVTPSPAAPTNAQHVFLIVMENRSYDQAMRGGYTAELAKQYAVATNYH